ncbi:MAG: hypothetical protein ACOX7O_09980 [Oscillospiraceae bacterium]|jgi:hypothetical protein
MKNYYVIEKNARTGREMLITVFKCKNLTEARKDATQRFYRSLPEGYQLIVVGETGYKQYHKQKVLETELDLERN